MNLNRTFKFPIYLFTYSKTLKHNKNPKFFLFPHHFLSNQQRVAKKHNKKPKFFLFPPHFLSNQTDGSKEKKLPSLSWVVRKFDAASGGGSPRAITPTRSLTLHPGNLLLKP